MNEVEVYKNILTQVDGLTANEDDLIANLANTAAVLYNELDEVNWAGFYLWKDGELVLGPFQGKPACIRIAKGKGVCGTALEKEQTLIVEDVHQFPGHIVCDAESKSEIVVPIIVEGEVKGVLDIDSPILNRFNNIGKEYLTKIVKILVQRSRWS
ncbi:GAF domain-containing protein [Halonatronum saccharophilum]|uniref:GAF domain-containing protein n=1 Tax=Halonatronum saccharophilum TaxID=150060 RepID=UPI000486338A|nr:GAF domain-containing protein [Halonatronum saccharophilum]